MPMAVIQVRRGPRGPLANYVQAVKKGMAGRGMGQDSTDTIVDPTTGITYDLSGNVVSAPLTPTNILAASTNLGGTPLPISGSTPPTGSPATASNSSGSFNLGNFLTGLTSDAASAAKIYNSLQTPSLIPGTNAIYNAATGQYYNPTTGQVVNPGGTSTLGIPTDLTQYMPQILLYGGLALGALLLLAAMGKH